MPAPDAAALLRRNGSSADTADRPAIRFGDEVWTHAALAAEAVRWANLFLAQRAARPAEDGRPLHVGVLLDNTPDYLFALAGAAFAGATVVGLNPTRVGEHLARDIDHTDIDLVVTEPDRIDGLAGIDLRDRRGPRVAPVLDLAFDRPVARTTSRPPWPRSATTTPASSTIRTPAGCSCSRPGHRARRRR